MANIEQNICDAIEVIANNIVSKAGFDRTIQATIVTCVNEATGKYKVKYQDNTLYAYSGDTEKKYSKGNRVYVLVPGNDMTKDKTILGIVGQNEEYIASEMGDVYERVTGNFVLMQEENGYSIYSGTEYNKDLEKPSAHYGKNADTVTLESDDIISASMEYCDYFYVSAKFKTNFDAGVTKGKYGLTVLLQCDDAESGITYIDSSVTLDFEHGITGQYYNFYNPEVKYFVFPKPSNFKKIDSIEIFAKDFVTQLDSDKIYENDPGISDLYDIQVTEIKIFGANSVSDTIGKAGIVMHFPNGFLYQEGMNSLSARADVYEKGKLMNKDANVFYWFRQDLSVNSRDNEKFCDIGGLGWSCLNSKDVGGNWIPAQNTFDFVTLTKNILTSKKNQFKVVSYRRVDEKTEIQYEEKFTILDSTKNFNIIIISNKDKLSLPRTTEDLAFTCKIQDQNGNDRAGTYRFYWGAESGIQNWRDAAALYNTFVCDFINNNSTISGIHFYRILPPTNSILFSCTVKQIINNEEVILETASSFVSLVETLTEFYTLEIENGTQIFQYDEYGDAPTINGKMTLEPLVVKLIDNVKNEEINLRHEIIARKLTINWEFPEEPTMIQTGEDYFGDGEGDQHWELNYTLISPFNVNAIGTKQITVTVNYDNKEFKKSTNFMFLTQGDMGTNGTSYSAVIVPNSINDTPKWVTFTKEGSNGGHFNFVYNDNNTFVIDSNGSHYVPGNPAFPFKVQLSGGGEIIFDGNEKGFDTRGNEVEVEWGMQILKYDNGSDDGLANSNNSQNKKWDRSNFWIENITDLEGNKHPIMKYTSILYSNSNNRISTPGGVDKELVPANILRCAITYNSSDDNKKYVIYASLPIVTIVNNDYANYTLDLDQNYGYSEVVYNRDGCMPRYDNINKIFKVNYNQRGIAYTSDKCHWDIVGHSGINANYECVEVKNLVSVLPNGISDLQDLKNNEVTVEPVYKFNGSSATNGILFRYGDITSIYCSYIHIPIDLHLNRFGLAMLNDWDGTSIEINDDGGYILAPQIGAGKKDENNSFTGVVMGEAKESSLRDMHTGLFGYYKGERSFGLFSDSGIATFGKAGSSQIVIDPKNDHGYIYSGNFFKNAAIDQSTGFPKNEVLDNLFSGSNYSYNRDNNAAESLINRAGMLIDLTEGHIYYGSDKFHLDQNGNLTCLDGHFSNGKLNYTSHDQRAETYFMDLSNEINTKPYFLYCRENVNSNTENFSVTKQGKITANAGKIGGFYISSSYISSNEDITIPFDRNRKSVISLSTIGFSRSGMTVVDPQNVSGTNILHEYSNIPNTILSSSFSTINLSSNIILNNLLFAIGDDFGVTEQGTLFARDILAQNGLYHLLTSQDLYIKNDCNISGDTTITGDLSVNGTSDLVGNVHTHNNVEIDNNLTVSGDIEIEDGYLDIGGTGIYYDGIVPSGSSFAIKAEVYNGTEEDILIAGAEQLPWMSYSSNDNPPSTLPTGHIFLVYEDS